MGLFGWFAEKFGTKKEKEKVKCPKCGSTDVGYYTVLSNFVQVMREVEPAKYTIYIECSNCKFNGMKDE